MKPTLGILSTHPIQYQAPLFRRLGQNDKIKTRVFFCHKPNPNEQGKGFGVPFTWDIDLTSGYNSRILNNISRTPTEGFMGYNTPEIKSIIKENRFSAFLNMGWNNLSMWQSFEQCCRMKIPIWVRSESQMLKDNKQTIKNLIKRMVYPLFIKRYERCFAIGSRSYEYFKYFGAKKVIKAPYGVDNDFFSSKCKVLRHEKEAIKRKFNIPLGKSVLLYAGKFESKKRPLDFIKAIDFANQQGVSVCGLMVGDGVLKRICEEYVHSRNIPVIFAGFLNQSEMPSAYSASDAIVMTSDRRETWGLVINEAMASGIPAIVSDEVGCSSDLIKPGITGYTFKCGNVDELTQQILTLVRGNELEALGYQSKNLVKNFSLDQVARRIVDSVLEVNKDR